MLVGVGSELSSPSFDIGSILGLGEPSMDRNQLGSDEPVSTVRRDVEHASDITNVRIAMFDGVVASVVGAVGVGSTNELVDAHPEIPIRQPFGVLEQHWSELGEAIADPPVAMQPREPNCLRTADATEIPGVAEPIDVVDGSCEAAIDGEPTARLAERPSPC